MCGIVGVLATTPVEGQLVARMRDQLTHRGPDHAGLWLSADARTCLGHRRLAIVDLTPEANQPFVSHDGRYVLTFNGEIYNFQPLRAELLALGARLSTQSDTEVLLEGYRYWGANCLDRLSGQFAFAIWDTVDRRLFCARDRTGEKPFYYALVDGTFLFASELKALLLWPGFRRRIHYPALVDYLSFGFIPDPRTIWEGCHKLPAGHHLCVTVRSDGTLHQDEPIPYWDLEFRPDDSVTDWTEILLETLLRVSKEMAFADVPVGAFLSGGVDSSSVTAALSKAGCSLTSFTIGFGEPEYDERPFAREVATRYSDHHVERVVSGEDVGAVLRQLVWHYDEPFNDYSYLPTFYLCRQARQAITVALSGDGADELFAGYRKYQRIALRQAVNGFLPSPVRRVLKGAGSLLRPTSQTRRTLFHYGLDSPEMLTDMLTLGLPHTAIRAAARGPLAEAAEGYAPLDTIRSLLRKAPPSEVGLINAMRYLDLKLTLGGDILVKVDRASMAVSLEVRPVYVHRDMLDLASRIPADRLADRNHAKRALKEALRSWLPPSILDRRKMGFAMPLKKWLAGDLRTLFGEQHKRSPVDDLVDATLLERTVQTHASGQADLTAVIHSLFFLKHWMAQWI
jgi:asparagine synthase (glutamine-hydrolysing)